MAVRDLEEDCRSRQRELDYQLFVRYDLTDTAERPTYGELAESLEVRTTTVTNRLAAARRRFRELVLERLRGMTASEREFREEARAVLGVAP